MAEETMKEWENRIRLETLRDLGFSSVEEFEVARDRERKEKQDSFYNDIEKTVDSLVQDGVVPPWKRGQLLSTMQHGFQAKHRAKGIEQTLRAFANGYGAGSAARRLHSDLSHSYDSLGDPRTEELDRMVFDYVAPFCFNGVETAKQYFKVNGEEYQLKGELKGLEEMVVADRVLAENYGEIRRLTLELVKVGAIDSKLKEEFAQTLLDVTGYNNFKEQSGELHLAMLDAQDGNFDAINYTLGGRTKKNKVPDYVVTYNVNGAKYAEHMLVKPEINNSKDDRDWFLVSLIGRDKLLEETNKKNAEQKGAQKEKAPRMGG